MKFLIYCCFFVVLHLFLLLHIVLTVIFHLPVHADFPFVLNVHTLGTGQNFSCPIDIIPHPPSIPRMYGPFALSFPFTSNPLWYNTALYSVSVICTFNKSKPSQSTFRNHQADWFHFLRQVFLQLPTNNPHYYHKRQRTRYRSLM